MNTRHRTIYQKFFARHDLVTSANFCISWMPSGFSGGGKCFRTTTKTPFECLVGVRPAKDKKTLFSPVSVYNSQKDIFENIAFSKITDQELLVLKIVEDFLQANNTLWLEIGILSETSRGHGFGFSGTMAAALATALFIFTKRCTPEETELPNFESTTLFQEIFNLAQGITNALRYDNALGSNTIAGLLPGNIFLTSTSDFGINIGDINVSTKSFTKNFPDVDPSMSIPVDYGIIFSGLGTDTKTIETHKKSDEIYLDRFSELLQENFADATKSTELFAKLSEPGGFYSIFSDALSTLSVEMVYFLRKLLEKGYEESMVDRLIRVANHYRYVLSMMIQPEHFPDRFRAIFLANAKHPNADIGLFPLYGWKMGGGYLFVMKPQMNREILEQTLIGIQTQYPNAKIEYANYIHGETFSSVRVRQDLSSGYVAKELKGGGGFLYFDNLQEFRVAGMNEILDERKDDILFNAATGEIFIQGNPVDSTQLRSQNATIELFLILLSKGNVSNRDLPTSSYSKNRSEMQSKILGPISKIVEEFIGKRLPIVCSGSITDFHIELEPTDIRIGAIKKLGK